MDAVATILIVAGTCATLGFLAMRTAGAGAEVVVMMFRSPAELGWPSGVQEDDDLHWSWSRLPADVGVDVDAGPQVRPEIVELPDGTGPRASPIARH